VEFAMHPYVSQVLQSFQQQQLLQEADVAHFSPTDFRQGIQWLLSQNQDDLAQALAEAGLSLHPHNQEVLAMAGLLAMTREDWPLAVELLEDLYEVQGEQTQPMTYQMLARAHFCNLQRAEAVQVLTAALQAWPDDAMLREELSCLGPEFNFPGASSLHH